MRYRFIRFPGGLAKAVTLSYDDGCVSDKRFSDRITNAGLKCTFNICPCFNKLTEDEIRDYILSRGHELAVHGKNHRAEGIVRPIEAINDIVSCRLELEENFKTIIRGMAYPDTGINRLSNGNTYEQIKGYLMELDIAYSRTAGGDNAEFLLPEDWYRWMPTAHHNNEKLMEYIDKFLSMDLSTKLYWPFRDARLFYMWGHSYEFDANDNWHLLDKICDKLSGRDDIWYATNMEIYEYVKAYNSLIYSADGRLDYNPTILDVWFDIGGKMYKICSGKTLNIE